MALAHVSTTEDSMKKPSSQLTNRLASLSLVLGIVLTTVAFLAAFLVAPLVIGAEVTSPTGDTAIIGGQAVHNKLLLSQKIFYFHVPVAIVSFVGLTLGAIYSIAYLKTRDARYDIRARTAMEVGLVFIIMTMLSGDLWTRFEWGVWWVWEPRLTTYLVLMLLSIGYFILRTSIDAPERRYSIAAVFSIITFVDAPLSLLITRLVPSTLHPVVFRTDSGLPPAMLIPFLLALFGMILVGFALYRMRVRQISLNARLRVLQARFDEQEATRKD
jgi:heme exporter protein C